VISPTQRPLPDNTQHSQETDIHAPGGIRIHNPSKLAAADPRLGPRGHWEHLVLYQASKMYVTTAYDGMLDADEGLVFKCQHGRPQSTWKNCIKRFISETMETELAEECVQCESVLLALLTIGALLR
jgi:hypothetical protein